MGFFGNAIKRGLRNAVSSTVANEVTKAINKSLGNDTTVNNTPAPVNVNNAPAADYAPQVRTNIRMEMPSILASDFGMYTAQQNVPASSLGVNVAPCRPYDYVLSQNGRAVAAIMFVDHNRDKNAAYLNAKSSCAQIGIPFINFYTHMPNERNFVISRIRRLIG